MGKQRYIVKYNHHSGDFGIYDMATLTIRWGMDRAQAASECARRNAVEAIGTHLDAAIGSIGTALSGAITPERRTELRTVRAELQLIRQELPDAETLASELARWQSERGLVAAVAS